MSLFIILSKALSVLKLFFYAFINSFFIRYYYINSMSKNKGKIQKLHKKYGMHLY